MKRFNYSFALAILALSFSMFSCSEDELTSSPIEVDLTQSAVVKGIAYAELDLQTNGAEFAPQGTSLMVTIPYSDLSSNAKSGNWSKVVTVGANGAFEVTVPSNNKGVTVTIKPTDFTADLKLENGSQIATQKTVYTSAEITASVKAGLTSFNNINFSIKSSEVLGFTALLFGEITGELDENNGVSETLPTGTIITFVGKKDSKVVWSKDFVVNGKTYTNFLVPAGISITASWNFKTNKNVLITGTTQYQLVKYSYVGNSGALGTFDVGTDNIKNINVGVGSAFPY